MTTPQSNWSGLTGYQIIDRLDHLMLGGWCLPPKGDPLWAILFDCHHARELLMEVIHKGKLQNVDTETKILAWVKKIMDESESYTLFYRLPQAFRDEDQLTRAIMDCRGLDDHLRIARNLPLRPQINDSNSMSNQLQQGLPAGGFGMNIGFPANAQSVLPAEQPEERSNTCLQHDSVPTVLSGSGITPASRTGPLSDGSIDKRGAALHRPLAADGEDTDSSPSDIINNAAPSVHQSTDEEMSRSPANNPMFTGSPAATDSPPVLDSGFSSAVPTPVARDVEQYFGGKAHHPNPAADSEEPDLKRRKQ